MDLSFIKQLNWVDITLVILFIRICYIATKSGTLVELFKLLGVIFGSYLALHYFAKASDFFDRILTSKNPSLNILDFLSVIVLWAIGYVIFLLIRETLMRFIKLDVVSRIDTWIALFLGAIRSILVASMVIYVLSMPVVSYLEKAAHNSYLGKRLVWIAPKLYEGIWNKLVSRFSSKGEINKTMYSIPESY